MRIGTCVLLAGLSMALPPAAGGAQGRLVHVNFGGGPTFAAGDLGSHFKTGWGPAIGVTIDTPSRRLGFQFEYAYRWFDINDELDAAGGVLDANHTTQQLDFNVVANLTDPDGPVRGYVVAGPGMYYREVEITKYEGSGIICDPYWYVCGTYPISSVVGSRGGWDFGFNFGGGIAFRIGEEAEFYIESRYHYVIGPEIEDRDGIQVPIPAASGGNSSTGHYIPLTFGFRF